jgi:hypothetical protein
MRALGIVLAGLVVVVSCGNAASTDDTGNSAGKAGSTSNAGAGATSAEGGSTSTDAGAGGSTSAGSTSLGGFTSSGEAECELPDDCQIVETCCGCFPAPVGTEIPECDEICEQSACSARGFSAPVASCRGNRCVFDVSCDRSLVTCRVAEPTCPEGLIPSVHESCWGPCVDPTECAEVGSCDDCPATPNQLCVPDGSTPEPAFYCVEITSHCAEDPTCACVDACWSACGDENGVACFCPDC